MLFTRNPQLEHELYERLRLKYRKPRPDIPHLSELIYCLTRSYFQRFHPLPNTDKELLYFSVGFGLESVLLRDASSPELITLPLDGVYMTPDYIDLQGVGVDLKSTRMYSLPSGEPKSGWPETWIQQFKAYAKLMGSSEYSVAIVYLLPPDLVVGTFKWTQEEIDTNWTYIKTRAAVYKAFIDKKTLPTPFSWNERWECNSCSYKLRCDTGWQPASNNPKEAYDYIDYIG